MKDLDFISPLITYKIQTDAEKTETAIRLRSAEADEQSSVAD
jgi:hypothetical protein